MCKYSFIRAAQAMVMTYEQCIMACVLVSEVLQLLIADPEGYTHMMMMSPVYVLTAMELIPFL
jgi:hypothetical protein